MHLGSPITANTVKAFIIIEHAERLAPINEIIADVNEAREMIALGLKLRNEKQVKIRQPLSTLYVAANAARRSAIETFGELIKSELNVLEIAELTDTSSLESNFLTLNFKVAGRVLKEKANPVKAFLATLDEAAQAELSEYVKAGKNVPIASLGIEVEAEAFTLNSKPADNIAIYKYNDDFAALDVNISEELGRAGLLRDIIRQCQVFRKEAGFEVSDKIFVEFITDSALATSVIADSREQLCHDLLAEITTVDAPDYTGNIDLDAAKITVKVKKQ